MEKLTDEGSTNTSMGETNVRIHNIKGAEKMHDELTDTNTNTYKTATQSNDETILKIDDNCKLR